LGHCGEGLPFVLRRIDQRIAAFRSLLAGEEDYGGVLGGELLGHNKWGAR
jgi:hypothetical protein